MQVGEGAALLHAGTPWVAHPREEVVLGDDQESLGRGDLIVGEEVVEVGSAGCLHPLSIGIEVDISRGGRLFLALYMKRVM